MEYIEIVEELLDSNFEGKPIRIREKSGKEYYGYVTAVKLTSARFDGKDYCEIQTETGEEVVVFVDEIGEAGCDIRLIQTENS